MDSFLSAEGGEGAVIERLDGRGLNLEIMPNGGKCFSHDGMAQDDLQSGLIHAGGHIADKLAVANGCSRILTVGVGDGEKYFGLFLGGDQGIPMPPLISQIIEGGILGGDGKIVFETFPFGVKATQMIEEMHEYVIGDFLDILVIGKIFSADKGHQANVGVINILKGLIDLFGPPSFYCPEETAERVLIVTIVWNRE